MRSYELTCLISPELPAEELNSLQEKIISFIQEEKGILVKIDTSFKKKSDNLLFSLNFQLNPGSIETLEKRIKEVPQISRYLLIAKEVSKVTEMRERPRRFPQKIQKPKVELKEIEKKLEEILGQ